MFGIDARSLLKRYELSIGYINLTLSDPDLSRAAPTEDVLSSSEVMESQVNVIVGAPGSGKTTIFSWIALNCAARMLQKGLTQLNSLTPVFIALREYADRELPMGDEILKVQLGAKAGAIKADWTAAQVRRGSFLFMLDGYDEVGANRRLEMSNWLRQLIESFPDSKFFISTRPYAASDLIDCIDEFDHNILDVEPMDISQIIKFVDHWYRAYAHDAEDRLQLERLRAAHERLKESLELSSTLRAISSNPLLCALICFVNADRDGFVPTARGDLYEIASETLLERRERERKIVVAADFNLTRQQKFKIMGFIAEYFFSRRSTQLPQVDIVKHIETFLPALGLDARYGEEIVRYLIERSQILRSPDEGSVDFSHKTFQEYFFARRIVDANLREPVAADFFLPDTHEVVLFVCALAPSEFVEWILRKSVEQITNKKTPEVRNKIIFLYSCVTEAAEISPELRKLVSDKLSLVLPPKSIDEAESLGSAGRSVIEPLAKFAVERHRRHWSMCATALVATMEDEAFPALAAYAKLGDKRIDDILLGAKRFFESDRYNTIVLKHCSHIRELRVGDRFDFELMNALQGLRRISIVSYDDDFEGLTSKDTVEELLISGISGSKTLEFLAFFPKLKHLEVSGSPWLDDFSGITKCSRLETLKIESEALTSAHFVKGLNSLRSVDLEECLNLTDVREIDNLLKVSDVSLPYASLYEQLNPRLRKDVGLMDEDADDYL